MRSMRISFFLVAGMAALWTGCGPDSQPAAAPVAEKVASPKPADDSRFFPKTDLVETKVIDSELMGKKFMPGGTLAHYKRGTVEFDMFVAKTTDGAYLLPDWSKVLTDAKLVASFGGYYGTDAGRPVFVFARGKWIVGIAGLQEKDADAEARVLANRIE
ncbi:exported hypothetical protein [Candidatus Sulfopaludibacter sp. SbA3]|nr:exported hypothetical protein [Candidatus Sulfopaludibacter sp. SbA3]